MNRRSLFKFLGIGAATAVVAPKMLAEKHSKVEYTCDEFKWEPLGNVYPTYADYTRSVTVDIGTEHILGVTEKRYDDMMEDMVLEIDKQLRMGAL